MALAMRPTLRTSRLNGTATVRRDDKLLAETEGAQMIVRVAVRAIFPNCPRYIPQLSLVAPSIYTPRPGPARRRRSRRGRASMPFATWCRRARTAPSRVRRGSSKAGAPLGCTAATGRSARRLRTLVAGAWGGASVPVRGGDVFAGGPAGLSDGPARAMRPGRGAAISALWRDGRRGGRGRLLAHRHPRSLRR